MVLLLHFHTTKVQLFFHIRKKNNNYFQKKCTFFIYILCGVKTPLFTRCTHAHTIPKTTSCTHNNNMQHTTDTLHGITTHTQEQNHDRTHIQQTHNNNLNTWTPGHSAHDGQGGQCGHSGQGKENTRQRNENTHRHMNRRRHMYMYNK